MFNVWYFIDNKLGGVTSLNYNLISHPLPGEVQTVLEIEQEEWTMARANLAFPNARLQKIKYSGKDHAYQFLKQLRNLVPDQTGALVLNYENEMAMLDHHEVMQTTYQLVHDDYNLRLAEKYGHLVDVFICHNTIINIKLQNLFPERLEQIFYLPHGVKIPHQYQQQEPVTTAPLKLLFLGRMAKSKGIFDLPLIDELLRQQGIICSWICIGNGPEKEAAIKAWPDGADVQFISPDTNEEVMAICVSQDVFVLPTRFEGSPVSLIETMSAGLVPVITRLPGGITDIVTPEIGFTPEPGENAAFADAIVRLHHNRHLLHKLSQQSRALAKSKYNIEQTAFNYHSLFQRYEEFYRPKVLQKQKVGARLDHPLIPASVTKLIRKYNKQK
jgi:glycosyltransferase involved in cell wall biosynthesis